MQFCVGFRPGAYRSFAEEQVGPNLTVLQYSHVTRVVVEGGRATGIQLTRFGRREEYTATREVILSAGEWQNVLGSIPRFFQKMCIKQLQNC